MITMVNIPYLVLDFVRILVMNMKSYLDNHRVCSYFLYPPNNGKNLTPPFLPTPPSPLLHKLVALLLLNILTMLSTTK